MWSSTMFEVSTQYELIVEHSQVEVLDEDSIIL